MRPVVPSTSPRIRLPNGYWNHPVYQKQLFDQISRQMGMKSLDDWYKVSASDVFKSGGGTVLSYHYKSSLYRALSEIYPEHNWQPWKFKQIPKKLWNSPQNIVDYFRWISEQIGITKIDEWLNVPRSLLEVHGGYSLLKKFGSLPNLLKHLYPHYPWEAKFRSQKSLDPKHRKSKAQQVLYKTLVSIFPAETIIQNYKHPTLLFPNTNREMELDFYIPTLNIAFEYQGQQHYFRNPLCEPPEIFQERDQLKKEGCSNAGVLLIEVPFWWNSSRDSLIATILNHHQLAVMWSFDHIETLKAKQHRKEAKPISPHMPQSMLKRQQIIQPRKSSGFPFQAVLGSCKGAYPKCLGCGKTFNNRNELRIEILGTFTSNKDSAHPTKYHVCCDSQCIEKAQNVATKRKSRAYFPQFANKIAISKSNRLGKVVPNLEFVEWITID